MTIRQELLKQAEIKLDKYIAQCHEAMEAITGDNDLNESICRILSTNRNASVRAQVIRQLADEREAELVAGWNDQADLLLGDEKEDL